VRWHRSGFKLYWAMLCKVRKPVGGGRRISQQIRELIFQMVADNPSWSAPRIHGELLMLGFDVSETTISRWMKRAPQGPSTRQALAGLSAQSSGSYRCHGFFHRPHSHLWGAVLLLHHRS
jgi:hypothetical protein